MPGLYEPDGPLFEPGTLVYGHITIPIQLCRTEWRIRCYAMTRSAFPNKGIGFAREVGSARASQAFTALLHESPTGPNHVFFVAR